MVAIIIISAVIRDPFKEKIEKSRVQKTVMFSLLKDYKRQLMENKISWHNKSNGHQQSTKEKNKRNRISNWKEVISTQHINSSKN